MKKILALTTTVAVFGLALGTTGCIGAPVVPPLGLIYTDTEAPLTLGPSDNTGQRRGTASVTSYLMLVSLGDGSVKAAAENGGIRKVERVEYEFTNILGLYQRYTTVAYGN